MSRSSGAAKVAASWSEPTDPRSAPAGVATFRENERVGAIKERLGRMSVSSVPAAEKETGKDKDVAEKEEGKEGEREEVKDAEKEGEKDAEKSVDNETQVGQDEKKDDPARSPTKRGVEKWRGKRREERGSDGIGRLDA